MPGLEAAEKQSRIGLRSAEESHRIAEKVKRIVMSKCALCIEDLKKPGLQPHDEACKDHLVCNICSFSKRKSDDPTLCSYCGINGCCAVKELLLGGGTPDCDVIFVESTLSLCESCAEEPAMNSYACEHSLCIERFENCITVQTEIKQIPVSVL